MDSDGPLGRTLAHHGTLLDSRRNSGPRLDSDFCAARRRVTFSSSFISNSFTQSDQQRPGMNCQQLDFQGLCASSTSSPAFRRRHAVPYLHAKTAVEAECLQMRHRMPRIRFQKLETRATGKQASRWKQCERRCTHFQACRSLGSSTPSVSPIDGAVLAEAASALEATEEEIQMRAFQLVCLIPGLETKLKRLQISILIGLMGDLRSVSHRMVSVLHHEAWLDHNS